MTFTYDDPTHTYTLDGYKIPSVSALLDMLFPKDFKGPAIIQGMSKGKYIHKCCNMDYHKLLDLRKLEPEIKPYIRHFRDFKKKHLDPINCIWEKPDYHHDLKYGYTRDVFDCTHGTVWDIKTGKKATGKLAERYKLQLMAYRGSIPYTNTMKILYLSPDGYEIKEVKWDSKLWNKFLCALTVFNFSRR